MERSRDSRVECEGRPRTHGDNNISKSIGIRINGNTKGKTAISLFKNIPTLKEKLYWGNHFWSRGYCVSTVGLDEEKIRRYVKFQEENERLEESQQHEFGLF